MKSLNNYRSSHNSINTFNPSNVSKLINFRKNNGIYPKKLEDNSSIFYRNKNLNLLKSQNLIYNSNNYITQKVLKNIDSSNDIKIQNNNSTYKNSLSTNNTNTNYYTKRRNQLYKNKNIKTIESETTQSRNINKYNGNSLSRTTWSSFSFTEGTNIMNPINGYDNEYNNRKSIKNKFKIFKNEKENLDTNEFNTPKFNEFNLSKLKENGIKYCIDMDGNPMNIIDIKLKNKNPIAFIIQKQKKNILVDLENKTINPNYNGDYILPQRPYFIIKKYDVQYPELRINNTNNNNYISIDVNDSNENMYKNALINRDKDNDSKKKFNKSCNLYNFLNGEEANKFYKKIDKKILQNKINGLNKSIPIKINSYKQYKDSLRDKKRKYIFVNKLSDTRKSIQLNINTDTSFSPIKQYLKSNNTCKNKTIIDNNFEYNNDANNKNDKLNVVEKKKCNFKSFINNLNKFKNKTNKLKDIKCFTHKEIKNLEFKFERKYKNYNTNQPSFFTDWKFNKIEQTPKENKFYKQNMTIISEKSNLKNNFDINDNELKSAFKNKFIIDKLNNLDLKKYKKKRVSHSLNQFMYNNMNKSNYATPNNRISAFSTFNHSFISPKFETTTYTTIQNLHREMEKCKNFPFGKNEANIKKFNSFKYYLKPKINSQKVFHKRIKTEDMNKSGKKFRFFKFMNGNGNDNNSNTITVKQFNTSENDFTIDNCKHVINSVEKKININNSINNNVCKCPYCNHLFYN